jgi:hypothetical protein
LSILFVVVVVVVVAAAAAVSGGIKAECDTLAFGQCL